MSLGGGFGIKVQTSLKTDRLGEITADLHEMIERYEEDVRRLIDLEQEISRAVNTLERDEYKLIMFERYVNLKRWEDVAEDNHYSLSAVNKIHRFALKAIERTLKSEGKSFSAARG